MSKESLKSLIKASEEGMPLAIYFPDGMVRVADHIFVHKRGILFVDIGWYGYMVSFNPFHVIEGEVNGVSPKWNIGNVIIRKIKPGERIMLDYMGWLVGKPKEATRKAALDFIPKELWK